MHTDTNTDNYSYPHCQPDSNTQTNAHSEIACDTEAATHTAAAAMR